MYNPQAIQPANLFFNIDIGTINKFYTGLDSEGYAQPSFPFEFEFTQRADGISLAEFTLYDDDGLIIDSAIWNSRNDSGIPGGTFSFGYTNGPSSDQIPFQIAAYELDVLDNSFAAKITSTPCLSVYTSTNQICGTIDQILQQIGNLHSLEVKQAAPLGQTFVLDAHRTVTDTSCREMRHAKLGSETDLNFAARIVRDYYLDNQGKGGYELYMGSENGQPVMYITRPDNSQPAYVYKVQDKDSPVIRFQPAISFDVCTWGGSDVFVTSHQAITGDTYTMPLQKPLTAPYQVNYPGPTNQSLTSTPPVGGGLNPRQIGWQARL